MVIDNPQLGLVPSYSRRGMKTKVSTSRVMQDHVYNLLLWLLTSIGKLQYVDHHLFNQSIDSQANW